MTTTDETKTSGDGAPPPRQPAWMKAAKRYGPIAAVVVLIGGAVVVFGGGGDGNGDDGGSGGDTEVASEDELTRSGPMTPAKAELEGVEVDFGPTCDTETGRIKLVSVYAAPCVEPFEGDNGGATSPGVTAEEVTIVNYISDPRLDPLTAATIEGAGADVSPESAAETIQGYADLYNSLYETYGRTVNVVTYTGTGAGDDAAAAQADAIAIAEMDPFAVVGGPTQAFNAFGAELASRGIVCGPGCSLATPEAVLAEYEPLMWGAGPTPDQAAALASEAIGNLAGPGPAELAGDEALQTQDRVYALLHYDNPDGDFEPVFQAYQEQLAANDIELETDIEFTLDLARAQENARTIITRLKEAGVTTVIYTGDPLTPASLTTEATAQGYFPEWILGSSVLMDTTIFARRADPAQWSNGFGISLPAARRALHQRCLPHLGLGVWWFAAQQHGQRARAAPPHHLHRHPPDRPGPDPGDVPRRPVPLPDIGRGPHRNSGLARRARRLARLRLGRHRRRRTDLVRSRGDGRGRGRQRGHRHVPLRQRGRALHHRQHAHLGRGLGPVRCRRVRDGLRRRARGRPDARLPAARVAVGVIAQRRDAGMSTTDETTAAGGSPGGTAPSGRPPAWTKAARRYGPIAAVVALIGGAVVVFGGGGGGDGDGDGGAGGDSEVASEEELIRSGPMTPQKAELEGVEVDFGPGCDTALGTITLPSVYAPPCVEPFEGDNGGATSPGVTTDEILIVDYQSDPALDPLTAAMVGGTGADIDPESSSQTTQGYIDLYNRIFETYGRTVRVETYMGQGAGDDLEAAKSDAIAIAEMEPFAVLGGPAQASPVFAAEIASRGIVCVGGCALALPEDIVEQYEPYLWQSLQTPNQGVLSASMAIGQYAGPGKAELAGDEAMRDQDRVYGVMHYDTPNGDHRPVYEEFVSHLEEQGIELATDIEFQLDLARSQENARTWIGKLKDAGVTTVIYYGDPITPSALTTEATAQDYWPEWILGPSLLMDTTIFGRLTDGEQWKNGFGVSTNPTRGAVEATEAFNIYDWAYGELPPSNTARVIEPPVRTIFNGIHMAGPDLNPETFRDAMFRLPPAGGSPASPLVSRGDHGFWSGTDWGGNDDGTLIWWDPTATGEDEAGTEGVGMYRYANGGERFTYGNRPDDPDEVGLFDVERSVTVYDEVPEDDRVPDYPPPG